jgi:hypothetical protein
MARQIVERYICDQDCGNPAVATEEFTVLGHVWQKDFCQRHLDEFRAAMAPWIDGANDVGRAPKALVSEAPVVVVSEEPVELPAPRTGVEWWLTPPGASAATRKAFTEQRAIIHRWAAAQQADGQPRFPKLTQPFLGKLSREVGASWTNEVFFAVEEPKPKNKAKRSLKII